MGLMNLFNKLNSKTYDTDKNIHFLDSEKIDVPDIYLQKALSKVNSFKNVDHVRLAVIDNNLYAVCYLPENKRNFVHIAEVSVSKDMIIERNTEVIMDGLPNLHGWKAWVVYGFGAILCLIIFTFLAAVSGGLSISTIIFIAIYIAVGDYMKKREEKKSMEK